MQGFVQPAEPDAARAAIVDAVAHAYGGASTEERAAAVEDIAALDQVVADFGGSSLEDLIAPYAAVATDVVFSTADRAWFRYQLTDAIGGSSQERDGEGVLIDGRWTVSNGTICADLRLGGDGCWPNEPDGPIEYLEGTAEIEPPVTTMIVGPGG